MSKSFSSLWLLWWQSLSLVYPSFLVLSLVPCTYWGRCSVSIYLIKFINTFFFKWLATACWYMKTHQVFGGDLISVSPLKKIISELCFHLLLQNLHQDAKILYFLQQNCNFSKFAFLPFSLKEGEGTNEWYKEKVEQSQFHWPWRSCHL